MNLSIKKSLVTLAGIGSLSILSLTGSLISNINYVQSAESSDKYTLLAPLPCIAGQGVTCNNGEIQKKLDFKEYVQYAFNLIIALAGVAAVFMIVWGGFKYITTASSGEKEAGRKTIEQAVKGLLLVLGSFLLLRTINPKLVEIPNTIVPPLNLKESLTKNYVQQSLAELQRLGDQYRIDISNVQDTVKQQQDDINRLTQLQNGLENQLNGLRERDDIFEDDPKILALQAQIQNIKNEIASTTVSQITKIGIGKIDIELRKGNIGPDSTIKQLNDIQAAIERDRAETILRLRDAPDKQALVNQEAIYLTSKIELTKVEKEISYLSINLKNGIYTDTEGAIRANLSRLATQINQGVTDPIKKEELRISMEKNKTELNKAVTGKP